MKDVSVIGWVPGFQKIRFTNILRRELGFSLSAAKSATDSVLVNRSITLQVADATAPELIRELESVGALTQVVESAMPVSA
jgi:hypothetical protein